MSDGGPMSRIRGGDTKSKSGDIVYKVTDLDFVKRFLIIGWPDITADSPGPNCNEVAEEMKRYYLTFWLL